MRNPQVILALTNLDNADAGKIKKLISAIKTVLPYLHFCGFFVQMIQFSHSNVSIKLSNACPCYCWLVAVHVSSSLFPPQRRRILRTFLRPSWEPFPLSNTLIRWSLFVPFSDIPPFPLEIILSYPHGKKQVISLPPPMLLFSDSLWPLDSSAVSLLRKRSSSSSKSSRLSCSWSKDTEINRWLPHASRFFFLVRCQVWVLFFFPCVIF